MHSAGELLVRWKSNSAFPASPVLCVVWQVSQPMSSAACRLPFSGTFKPCCVAGKAKIRPLVAGDRLQQLVLVVATMRIVTLDAVAHGWRMNRSLDAGRVFFSVATQAQRLRSRCDQLDPRDVFVHADFVTAQTSSGDRGVHCLALGLFSVAFKTLC